MSHWVTGDTNTVSVTTTTPLTPSSTPEPVLPDLEVSDVNNQITSPLFVAALPSGEAAVVSDFSQVVKINNAGGTVNVLYDCNSCYSIYGLLLLGSYLYVTHYDGTIVEINPYTGDLRSVYHIPDVVTVTHYGSLWFDPSFPDPDILLLTDYDKGEVFSYDLTSGNKQVHVTNLDYPTSVSYIFNSTNTSYILCHNNMVNIYNSNWKLYSSFQGNLDSPVAAIMSSNNTLLVSNSNGGVSVFTTEGDFLYNLPIQMQYPLALSYFKPYLWISHDETGLYRYRLDQ